jgi:hypothetical protein
VQRPVLCVDFAAELGRGVRRRGRRLVGLALRKARAIPVNRGGTRQDDPADAGPLRALQQRDRARLGRPMGFQGLADRAGHGHLGRQVIEDGRPFGRSDRQVDHVSCEDLDSGRQVARAAGREVVDHAHPASAREERPDQVRADEARASGHDMQLRGAPFGRRHGFEEPVPRGSLRAAITPAGAADHRGVTGRIGRRRG